MEYRCLTPISYNGVNYGVGDVIELSGDETAQLFEVKAIEPYRKPYAQNLKPTKIGNGEER